MIPAVGSYWLLRLTHPLREDVPDEASTFCNSCVMVIAHNDRYPDRAVCVTPKSNAWKIFWVDVSWLVSMQGRAF